MWLKLVVAFVLWMVFAFSFLQSITVTVAWWKGEQSSGFWEWLWIGLLPVWVFVYFSYYSIFRPDCRACLPPEHHSSARPDKP
ncbi:MAG: hypothetical protein A3D32_05975 [Candidatus Muproteobacteria bacterium RIFCSPHIGHO2_02_FULL_60_13]|nr:MAG: hypothetical protein A3D32_05975 [Candidatus Muproteobacteria bacterium RIFCSPHIGHO2_02_FULL_60_13]